MIYAAHSPKDGIPAQSYVAHISGVLSKVRSFAQAAAQYSKADGKLLMQAAETAAIYHDLGKLAKENQVVLNQKRTRDPLPVHHADAGTAHLLSDANPSILSAVAVSSHHTGLPDFAHEINREEEIFRDSKIFDRTNNELSDLLSIHDSLIRTNPVYSNSLPQGDLSVFLRVLLSCIVDGDHTDTAQNDQKYPENEPVYQLCPNERLEQLDRYVASLQSDDERGRLRTEMYFSCRNRKIDENLASCSSPVGSGKTTAVMAHLLAQAKERGLRRIMVVLPYTNIIQQSVDIYRKALVLPGENPEEVVAELHHRADFENEDTRYLTALWRAPIIVTTAVAFFETLASKGPAGLRRLHELPGSALFIDESHAALPVELLPVAWRWMQIYACEWSCYWVLASGSLNRFWDIPDICSETSAVPEIVDEPLRNALDAYENKRICYQHDLVPKQIDEFISWIGEFQGPRLVILNTVQSAAVIADYCRMKNGRERVEHLSTALIPSDRERTLERIQLRLKDSGDKDWTLFATSCIEAGVDLSFRTGFRELASLISLLQTAGRIDRGGVFKDSELWSFCLAEDERLKSNPGIRNAAKVLRGYLEKGAVVDPSLTTKAIQKELRLYGLNSLSESIVRKESNKAFPFVDENFRVIKSNTKLAVMSDEIAMAIASGHFSWRALQMQSLQIAEYKLNKLRVPQITEGIYHWTLGYDDFVGYMRGIIDSKAFSNDGDDVLIL